MSEDRLEEVKQTFQYGNSSAEEIDWLISEVERLRDSCENTTFDLMVARTTIATLRDHLRTDHDIAVSFTRAAGVRHDKETCATCKVLGVIQKEAP